MTKTAHRITLTESCPPPRARSVTWNRSRRERNSSMTRMQQVSENAAVYGIWTGIVLILLTPFVVTPDTIFPFVVGKAVYSRSLIECVFGVWAILALFRPAYRPPRSRLLLLLALSVGVSILAACFGVSPQRSFWSTYERMQGVVDLIHWFAFAVVLASVLRTERAWRVILNINGGVCIIVSGLAVSLYYSVDVPFFDYSYHYWDENKQAGIDTHGRVTSTLGNALHLSTYVLLNSLIVAGLLVQSFISAAHVSPGDPSILERGGPKRAFLQNKEHVLLRLWIERCFWVSQIIFSLWTLILVGSRGALLSLLASGGILAAVFLFRGRRRMIRFAAAGFVGLFVCAAALVLFLTFRPEISVANGLSEIVNLRIASTETFPVPLLKRLLEPQMYDAGDRSPQWSRIEILNVGLCGFFERPLLGWGPDNFLIIFGRYLSKSTEDIEIHDHAHNALVEELATKGVLGLSSYLALWICTLLIFLHIAKRVDVRSRIHPLFVGTALVVYFIQSQYTVANITTSLLYCLLLAFVTRLETAKKKIPTVERRHTSSLPNAMRAILVASVLTSVGVGFLVNQAIYSAAFSIKKSTDQTNVLGQSIGFVKQAITQFGPLANTPRNILFANAPDLWTQLRLRNTVEAERLLRFLNSEAAAALADEPENWMIYSNLAEMYRIIAAYNMEYEDVVRRYSERARGRDSSPKWEAARHGESDIPSLSFQCSPT